MFNFETQSSVEIDIGNLHVFAKDFLDFIKKNFSDSVVVALSGDLGAGKTTFSKEIAVCLGVSDVVISPTFIIQKKYKTKDNIFHEFVHIDAYRIETKEEVGILKLEELSGVANTLTCIEWPEKVQTSLPKNTIWLSFETIDEHIRKISYKGVI